MSGKVHPVNPAAAGTDSAARDARVSFPRLSINPTELSAGKITPSGGKRRSHRASEAWYSNVQKVLAKQRKDKPAPKLLSIFRDKQRQLSVKRSRAGCWQCVNDLRNKIQLAFLSTWFNIVLTLLIIANAVLVGFVVDYQANCLQSESEKACLTYESDEGREATFTEFETMRTLNIADIVFTGVFTVELLLKFFSFGRDFWTFSWNVFDFFVITVSVAEAVFSLSITTSVSDDSTLLTVVPILRTLRVLRILRIMRLVSLFADLSILVKAAAFSARPAGWVLFLGTLFTYIFSILTTRLFGQADPAQVVNHDQLVEWFGTVPRSMYSLFQIMTLESWSMGIVRVVMQDFPYAPLLFVTWIVVMTIGVLNLLAAVFVNSYMTCSNTVADEIRSEGSESNAVKVKHLKELLQCNVDEYLSPEDFIDRVKESYESANALQDLVTADRVARAFQCIDVETTGGKASFDDLFQIALSLEETATKEDNNHTWLLLAHYAGAMSEKLEHMTRIVTDVKTVQQVQDGKIDANGALEDTQATQLIQQCVELALPWFPDRGADRVRNLLHIPHAADPEQDAELVDYVTDPTLIDRLTQQVLNASNNYEQPAEQTQEAIPMIYRRASKVPMFTTRSFSNDQLEDTTASI